MTTVFLHCWLCLRENSNGFIEAGRGLGQLKLPVFLVEEERNCNEKDQDKRQPSSDEVGGCRVLETGIINIGKLAFLQGIDCFYKKNRLAGIYLLTILIKHTDSDPSGTISLSELITGRTSVPTRIFQSNVLQHENLSVAIQLHLSKHKSPNQTVYIQHCKLTKSYSNNFRIRISIVIDVGSIDFERSGPFDKISWVGENVAIELQCFPNIQSGIGQFVNNGLVWISL